MILTDTNKMIKDLTNSGSIIFVKAETKEIISNSILECLYHTIKSCRVQYIVNVLGFTLDEVVRRLQSPQAWLT